MDRLVRLEILGETFTIRTDAEEVKVRAAAELVSAKIEEYRRVSRSNIKLSLAVLAALDLANEFLQLQDTLKNLKNEMEARSQEIIQAIEATV